MEEDGRFEEAINLIDMKLNLHRTLTKDLPDAPFPPSLCLEPLPYTVLGYYSEEEQKSLFGDDADATTITSVPTTNALAVVNRFNDSKPPPRQPANPYNRDNSTSSQKFSRQPATQQSYKYRPRLDETCEACGKYGHQVSKNGCDFCAQLILADKYIKNNPNMANDIVEKYQRLQRQRRNNLPRRGNLSARFQANAKKHNLNINGKVRTLMDVLGETMESEFHFSDEDQVSDEELEIFQSSPDKYEDAAEE